MYKSISYETAKRLSKFPELEKCVLTYEEDPMYLDDVTVYIRRMNVDEPELFDWDEEITEDFCTWGHNSRYANVLEPMLEDNFDEYINIIMDYVEELNDYKTNSAGVYNEDFSEEEED